MDVIQEIDRLHQRLLIVLPPNFDGHPSKVRLLGYLKVVFRSLFSRTNAVRLKLRFVLPLFTLHPDMYE